MLLSQGLLIFNFFPLCPLKIPSQTFLEFTSTSRLPPLCFLVQTSTSLLPLQRPELFLSASIFLQRSEGEQAWGGNRRDIIFGKCLVNGALDMIYYGNAGRDQVNDHSWAADHNIGAFINCTGGTSSPSGTRRARWSDASQSMPSRRPRMKISTRCSRHAVLVGPWGNQFAYIATAAIIGVLWAQLPLQR